MRSRYPVQLRINDPCSQSWHKMTPDGTGRFCDHCQKTVVDYSAMSDAALLSHIRQHGLSCGRLRSDQLDRVITEPVPSPGKWWPGLFLGIGVLLGFSKEAKGQHQTQPAPAAYEATQNGTQVTGTQPSVADTTTPAASLSGMVVDHHGEPVINALVAIWYQDHQILATVTDIDGLYVLKPIPAEWVGRRVTVRISSIGQAASMEIDLVQGKNEADAQLPQSTINYFTVGALVARHYTPWQRTKLKIRRMLLPRHYSR